MKKGQLVGSPAPPIHVIGERRIRVLLSSGKPMNARAAIPAGDVPRSESEFEVKETQGGSSEQSGSQDAIESLDGTGQSRSSPTTDGETADIRSQRGDFSPNGDDELHGIHPVPEPESRDIRFVDLPYPRRQEQQDSHGNSNCPEY